MSTKVLYVLAVYAVAVESAKHAHSAQYILKHDDHHHLVHVHPPVHAHHHKPHHDYYVTVPKKTNPKYDMYEVKPKHSGPYRPQHEFINGDVREFYSLDEPDDPIRHVQFLAEKHTGLLSDDVKHGAHHPHHIHHYHHHHHHHHKRESF